MAPAQAEMIPAAWQYRVMFDATHSRRAEWCPWRDAGEKYFNKVNAEIAAGATRVQTRILYALSDGPQAVQERDVMCGLRYRHCRRCTCQPSSTDGAVAGTERGGIE